MKHGLILAALIVGSLTSGCASLANACGQAACNCAFQLAIEGCVTGVDTCLNSGVLGAQRPQQQADANTSTEDRVQAVANMPTGTTPMRF